MSDDLAEITTKLSVAASHVTDRLSCPASNCSQSSEDSPSRATLQPLVPSTADIYFTPSRLYSIKEYLLMSDQSGHSYELIEGEVHPKHGDHRSMDIIGAHMVSEIIEGNAPDVNFVFRVEHKKRGANFANLLKEAHVTHHNRSERATVFSCSLSRVSARTPTRRAALRGAAAVRKQIEDEENSPGGTCADAKDKKTYFKIDGAGGDQSIFDCSSWPDGMMPCSVVLSHAMEWISKGTQNRFRDCHYKYVMFALSNVETAIFVDPAGANGTNKSRVVVCRKPIDANGYPVNLGPKWERSAHGDFKIPTAMCGCGRLLEECTGEKDLCNITKRYRRSLYYRRVYVDSEPIDAVDFLFELHLTPKILGDLTLLTERWKKGRLDRRNLDKEKEKERELREEAERREKEERKQREEAERREKEERKQREEERKQREDTERAWDEERKTGEDERRKRLEAEEKLKRLASIAARSENPELLEALHGEGYFEK